MPRPNLRSVRFRTTLAATALTAVVLVIGSIAIVTVVERDLVGNARESLEQAYAQARPGAGAGDPDARRLLRVRDGDDTLLLAYDEPTGAGPDRGLVEGFLLEPGENEPIAIVTFDPDDLRVLAVSAVDGRELDDDALELDLSEAAGADEVSVANVLTDAALHEVRESIDAVAAALLLIVPALVVVLAGATWFLVGRALRPVHAISAQVSAISASTLDDRVPVPQTRDEIAELAQLMNEMLDRLETGSQRQRQFVADASHELRSPLSTIKAAAEVAQASDDPARFAQLADDVDAEADRMELLIADLLDLARLDEGASAPPERVDLEAVCRDAVERLPHGGLAVTLELAPATVTGDRGQLERAIFNLALNACQHAHGQVRVGLAANGDRVVLDVDDDGAGIGEADRERVFDRFVRLDSSRARDTGGAGLGLALVRRIVERHHGTVTVDEAPTLGGARFRVLLPRGSET